MNMKGKSCFYILIFKKLNFVFVAKRQMCQIWQGKGCKFKPSDEETLVGRASISVKDIILLGDNSKRSLYSLKYPSC